MDNDRFPVRKNPRMRDYAYSTPNYYFIIICTHQKHCLFGEPGALNFFGMLAEQGLLSINDHIIRNQTDYQRIWEYIDTNPLKWKEDCFYSDNSSFE